MQQRQIKSTAVPHLQELTGRTAIVTGSTSGIGLGIAQAFTASGMHVMPMASATRRKSRRSTDMEEAKALGITIPPLVLARADEATSMPLGDLQLMQIPLEK